MKNIYAISRISIAVIFLYHGVVPKLLFANSQEVMMNEALMPFVPEKVALISSGVAEVIYAVLLIVFYRSKKLLYPAIGFATLVTPALLITVPELFKNAFNPFSINLALVCLCVINLKASADQSPTAEIPE